MPCHAMPKQARGELQVRVCLACGKSTAQGRHEAGAEGALLNNLYVNTRQRLDGGLCVGCVWLLR
jgi:hypothetical protein